jgi:hypothetical protein
MMTKTILGIDPGAHGAIAMLDEAGELLEVARHADDARGERQEPHERARYSLGSSRAPMPAWPSRHTSRASEGLRESQVVVRPKPTSNRTGNETGGTRQ